jgi:ribose transport system permease protein
MAGNEMALKRKSLMRDQRILLLIIIVAIMVVVSFVNPNFIKATNIVSLFQQIAVLGLLTMGMAMVMLSGGLDLAVGNIMILSGCTTALLISGRGIVDNVPITSVPVGILVGLAIAVGCGFLDGFIVAKSKCLPLIITLGMSNVYYGLALIITDGQYMNFDEQFEGLRMLKIGEIIPITLLIFIGGVALTHFLINRTKFGRRIVAIGGNEENAWLSGIKIDKYKIITYTAGGAFCGLGMILLASRLNAITAGAGAGYELNALTGCVVGGITFDGGRGTIIGAFLGVFFMGLVSNVMNILGVNSYYQSMISGIIIVAAVIISNINVLRKK